MSPPAFLSPSVTEPNPPASGGEGRPRDYVLFYLNGRRHQVSGGTVFAPLAEYLRDERRLVGTKLVCTEGDCGACTVLVGRPDGDRLRYEPLTSCILALHQVDGAHVITVEGLSADGGLNPVQAAMVEHHGSQCGFCTPGMVVALTAALEEHPRADAAAIKRALTGNLCRCTGYLPILEAALAAERSEPRPLADLYPSRVMLDDLQTHVLVPVLIEHAISRPAGGGARRVYFSPRSLDDAVAFKAEHPEAVIIAGGTELGVERNKGGLDPPVLLSLRGIADLSRITREGDVMSVGANVTWTRLEDYSRQAMPEFHTIARLFASPQVRNAGTLVGNVAFGSPVADSIGYLTVAGAEVELVSRGGIRWLRIDEFHEGYKQTAIRPDEVITRLIIPLPSRGDCPPSPPRRPSPRGGRCGSTGRRPGCAPGPGPARPRRPGWPRRRSCPPRRPPERACRLATRKDRQDMPSAAGNLPGTPATARRRPRRA